MKNLDDRLRYFLNEISDNKKIEILVKKINFDALLNNPKKHIKQLTNINLETRLRLFKNIELIKNQNLIYQNNILNFFKLRIYDLPIIVLFSILMYFQVSELISEIEKFYDLSSPKLIFVLTGCVIFSTILYMPLKTFHNSKFEFSMLLLLNIIILLLSAIFTNVGLYLCFIVFIVSMLCNIIFFIKTK